MIVGKRKNVSSAVVEDLKRKAECLKMSSPIIVDPNHGQITLRVLSHHAMHTFADVTFTCVCTDICPEDIPPSEGLSALNSLFEAKMGHRVARVLDALFDILVN